MWAVLKNVWNIKEANESTHLAYRFSYNKFRFESSMSNAEDQLWNKCSCRKKGNSDMRESLRKIKTYGDIIYSKYE